MAVAATQQNGMPAGNGMVWYIDSSGNPMRIPLASYNSYVASSHGALPPAQTGSSDPFAGSQASGTGSAPFAGSQASGSGSPDSPFLPISNNTDLTGLFGAGSGAASLPNNTLGQPGYNSPNSPTLPDGSKNPYYAPVTGPAPLTGMPSSTSTSAPSSSALGGGGSSSQGQQPVPNQNVPQVASNPNSTLAGGGYGSSFTPNPYFSNVANKAPTLIDNGTAAATNYLVGANYDAQGTLGGAFQTAAQQYSPYNSQGAAAYGQMANLAGVNGNAAQNNAIQTVQNTPGYQFQYNQGLQALQAQMAAQGYNGSDPQFTNAMKYGQDYANSQINNQMARLQQLAQYGMQGAQGTANAAQNIGTAAAQQYASSGNALANNQLANTNAQLVNDYNLLGASAGTPAGSLTSNTAALNNPSSTNKGVLQSSGLQF